MKPDAAMYAHVERVAAGEGIEPQSILFFDDHPANVAAARARAGARRQSIQILIRLARSASTCIATACESAAGMHK